MKHGQLRGSRRQVLLIGFVALLLLLPTAAVLAQPAQPDTAADWKRNWGLAPGFKLEIDTEGFAFPSAMAFVPEPGPGPKDPLYFVVELRGKLKVVTNDRSVMTFAENPYPFVPQKELPAGYGQGGTGGVCLDPQHGYVFLTFLYQDETKQLRNGLIRYDTKPGTFAVAPSSERMLSRVFEHDVTGLAHFVGSCIVKDDLLYVGVGEGWQPQKAQDLSSTVGKLLRMTLDGEPVPDNPFYKDGDTTNPTNYVWAYGLRNPWGLSFVGDRLFSADNGASIDRFIEVEEGRNYFWNGRDESIATDAHFVWTPAVGPTQMAYAGPDSELFPESFRDLFFIGTSGSKIVASGIETLRFDYQTNRLAEPPRYFLRWLASEDQLVMGVVFGPDGLYFAPLYPGPGETSPVLKISYDPAEAHPYGLDLTSNPRQLFSDRGCIGCHRLDGAGGYGGTAGPDLDRKLLLGQIRQRVTNEAYLRSLDAIDTLTTEPQVSYRAARDALRQADEEERIRLWVKYRILEPRFDSPASQMPNLGLSEYEAEALADFLLVEPKPEPTGVSRLVNTVNQFFRARSRVAIAAFALGALTAGGAVLLIGVLRRRGKARTP